MGSVNFVCDHARHGLGLCYFSRNARAGGDTSGIGLLLGHFIAIVIVAAGIGALVASNPIALTVLTVIGSAYLAWFEYADPSVSTQ